MGHIGNKVAITTFEPYIIDFKEGTQNEHRHRLTSTSRSRPFQRGTIEARSTNAKPMLNPADSV